MKKNQFLIITVLFYYSNLFPQYYIGQDKIDLLQNNLKKTYRVDDYFKSTNFKVYLESVGQDNHASDVKIGFDKLRYKRGETIVLTFSRTGLNMIEFEKIMIAANNKITAEFKIDSSNGYYIFSLKRDEVKKILIHPKNRNQDLERIDLGIGKFGAYAEGRSYIVPYPIATGLKHGAKTDSNKIFYRSFKDELKEIKKK